MFDNRTKRSTGLAVKPAKNSSGGRILVLGLGNILLKDEGVGVHAARLLQKQALASNVEVVDGGTASLDVLLPGQSVEKLIVIDAIKTGNKPGTIFKARFESSRIRELEEIFDGDSKISLHQMGLIDALLIAEKMNCAPKEIVIIGAEPKELDYGLELTNELKHRLSEVVNTVLKEIEDAIH